MTLTQSNEGMVFAALSPETRRALEKYSADNDFDEWLGDRGWIAGEWFAWLIALLKAETDTSELFPKGKWATIQRMEQLLSKCAEVTIKARRERGPAAGGKDVRRARSHEALAEGVALMESAFAHVSHGGPTRADAEAWLSKARQVLHGASTQPIADAEEDK